MFSAISEFCVKEFDLMLLYAMQSLAAGNFAYSESGDTCVQLATHGNLGKVTISALICVFYVYFRFLKYTYVLIWLMA